MVVCSACSIATVQQVDTPSEIPATQEKPVQQQVPGPPPSVTPPGKNVKTVKVKSRKRSTNAVYRRVGPDVQLTIPSTENVIPGRSTIRGRGKPVELRTEKAGERLR